MRTTTMTNEDVLALHLGSNVGCCFSGTPTLWVLPKQQDNGYIGAAMLDALDDFCRLSKPSRIVVSDSLNQAESHEAAALQVGLVMCIQVFGVRMSLPVELVHPDAVHEVLFERTGLSRRALKAATAGFAKRRGLINLDEDAANAFALYEFSTRMKTAA